MTRSTVATFGLMALAVLGLIAHSLVFGFITDDAYISFRYAENLAQHGRLEFNLGERVEGITNLLWTLLLAGLYRFGFSLERIASLLGLLFGAGGLIVTWALARQTDRSWHGTVPTLFLAALPAYACWTSGGLETQLFTLLTLLGSYLLLSGSFSSAGFAFGLSVAVRPEGALLFALAALADATFRRRFELRLYLGFVVPFAALVLGRLAYFGEWLPNTFYVKANGPAALARGGRYLWSFLIENHLWAALVLLPLFRMRDRQLWWHAAFTAFPFLLYVAWVGGDFMALHRFVVPITPYLALLLVDCCRTKWTHVLLTLLVAASVANAVHVDQKTLRFVGARDGVDSVGYLKLFVEDRLRVGEYLRRTYPKDTLISVGGAGALPFASKLPTLDAFGLNDAHIAKRVKASSQRPGHQKVAPLSYLLERRPDLVCFPPHSALKAHGYRWKCLPVSVDRRSVPGGRYCCWEKQ